MSIREKTPGTTGLSIFNILRCGLVRNGESAVLCQIFAEGRDVSADYAASLVVWLAPGAGDRLTGRFVSRLDDLDALLRAASTSTEDRRTLRLLP